MENRKNSNPNNGVKMDKAKNFKETMKKLMDYISPYKVSIILVMIMAIGSTIFAIVGPKIMGNITTEVFNGLVNKVSGKGDGIDFTYIRNIVILLLGLYLLSTLLSYVQGFIMTGVAQKISYGLRKQVSEKINLLPLGYFETKNKGEILSRVTNDIDTISQTLNQSLSQIITSITTLIGVLVMMISISIPMTLAALAILPVSILMVSTIIKKSQVFFKGQQEYLGHVNAQVEEVYGGHTIMKAFNGEEKATEEFEKLNDTLYESAWKSQFFSGMMNPIMTFVGNLGYVVISILGGWLTIRKSIQVGDILSFIQYVRQFNQPIAQFAQISGVLQSTAAAAERVFEFLEEKEEVKDTDNPKSVENIRGNVDFVDVNFGYKQDETIINDFTATVKEGQSVAIVGPTGAGKTTMVKLLMRFYDVNSGKILIDGNDIRDFKRKDLRSLFGMVLQDTWLFNGTIMDNIRYGKQDATMEQVIEASKAAHVHHFVKTLPQGYDTIISEDAGNLSQGQMQLLTIARVILTDPKILILDEATSSVDTRTEILIQKAMDNLMKGRTSFIIAHRLSTIKEADMILVMKDGDIVETGTHQQLLDKKGFYNQLYTSQFSEELI